jgi:hypothetical protein
MDTILCLEIIVYFHSYPRYKALNRDDVYGRIEP